MTIGWREKQSLTSDLFDIIKPKVSVWVGEKQEMMLRSILKEVIQAGYRKQEIPKTKKVK